jgi:hypothetical protein
MLLIPASFLPQGPYSTVDPLHLLLVPLPVFRFAHLRVDADVAELKLAALTEGIQGFSLRFLIEGQVGVLLAVAFSGFATVRIGPVARLHGAEALSFDLEEGCGLLTAVAVGHPADFLAEVIPLLLFLPFLALPADVAFGDQVEVHVGREAVAPAGGTDAELCAKTSYAFAVVGSGLDGERPDIS